MVWVGSRASDSILRLDPGTSSVAATVSVCDQPRAVAADGTGVWVACVGTGDVWHVDHDGKQLSATPVNGEPTDLIVVNGRILGYRSPALNDDQQVAARVEQLFEESGAYRQGHFKLKSGRHGDRYLEKFQVLQWPERVAEICGYMADVCSEAAGGTSIDVVVGPTTGGVLLAYEVAHKLGTRGFFAESVATADGQSRREFRRGFHIEPGERVALVDDVVTTGASLLEMIPLIESTGGILAATVVIVDRSGQLDNLVSPATGKTYSANALWSLDLPTYEAGPATCPGCAAGLPLHAPGSSGTTSAST